MVEESSRVVGCRLGHGQSRRTLVRAPGQHPPATPWYAGTVIRVGTSGWSYPSWRPASTPRGCSPPISSRFYAERFDTVELNSTGYRLPSEDQFRRWADGGTGRVPLRGQAPADPARPRHAVPRARARARRPARAGTRRRRGRAGRRARLVRRGLRAAGRRARVGLPPRVVGGGAEGRWSASTTPTPNRSAICACASRRTRTSSSQRPLPAIRDPAYVFLRHEDEPTAPVYAQTLRATV